MPHSIERRGRGLGFTPTGSYELEPDISLENILGGGRGPEPGLSDEVQRAIRALMQQQSGLRVDPAVRPLPVPSGNQDPWGVTRRKVGYTALPHIPKHLGAAIQRWAAQKGITLDAKMLQSIFQSLYGKGLAAPEGLSIKGQAGVNRFSFPEQEFSALTYPTNPGPHYRWGVRPNELTVPRRDIKKGEIFSEWRKAAAEAGDIEKLSQYGTNIHTHPGGTLPSGAVLKETDKLAGDVLHMQARPSGVLYGVAETPGRAGTGTWLPKLISNFESKFNRAPTEAELATHIRKMAGEYQAPIDLLTQPKAPPLGTGREWYDSPTSRALKSALDVVPPRARGPLGGQAEDLSSQLLKAANKEFPKIFGGMSQRKKQDAVGRLYLALTAGAQKGIGKPSLAKSLDYLTILPPKEKAAVDALLRIAEKNKALNKKLTGFMKDIANQK